MNRLYFFMKNSWLSFKSVCLWLRPQAYVIEKIVNPLFQLLFFSFLLIYGYKNKESAIGFIISNVVLLSSISALGGVGIIYFSERHMGTLIYSIVCPKEKFKVFLQKMPFHVADALITVFIGLIFVMLYFKFHFDFLNLALLILVIVIGVVSVSAFGLLMSSFGLLTRDINMLLNFMESLIILLSGANFPVTKLPVFLRPISDILPLSHTIKSINLILNGQIGGIYTSLLGEAVLIIIYMVLSFFVIAFLEHKARVHGNSDFY